MTGAIKAALAVALSASAALPACVVASEINIGTEGGGLQDLLGDARPGGGARPTPTPTPTAKPATTGPAAKATPTPTPKPPITFAADGWAPQTSGVSVDLHAVTSRALANGRPFAWSVGDGGTILRTTNGGDTWVKVDSGTTKDLYGVNYSAVPVASQTASESFSVLAGGADGTLVLSRDSGVTWEPLPSPVATPSGSAAGSIRQVDIWDIRTKKRYFVSSDRYPLIVTPDDSGAAVWDQSLGPSSPALPARDAGSWSPDLTRQDASFWFSFYSVQFDRAYGLLLARDLKGVSQCGGPAVCIGFPDASLSDFNWRFRTGVTYEGKIVPDGDATDISTVPDPLLDCKSDLSADSPLVAFMSTTAALYRTASYGKTWAQIHTRGADRIMAAGWGHVMAVGADRIWHGQNLCAMPDTPWLWQEVVLAPGDFAPARPADQFLSVTRSTDQGIRLLEAWLVGKGGRIVHRAPRPPAVTN